MEILTKKIAEMQQNAPVTSEWHHPTAQLWPVMDTTQWGAVGFGVLLSISPLTYFL